MQLLQKTNQFNLTTRRYAEKELLELERSGAWICLASLKDHFGDYGRIALAIITLDGPQPLLDSFLMSCRAIGRKAETRSWPSCSTRLRARGAGKSAGPVCSLGPKSGLGRFSGRSRLSIAGKKRICANATNSELSLANAGCGEIFGEVTFKETDPGGEVPQVS